MHKSVKLRCTAAKNKTKKQEGEVQCDLKRIKCSPSVNKSRVNFSSLRKYLKCRFEPFSFAWLWECFTGLSFQLWRRQNKRVNWDKQWPLHSVYVKGQKTDQHFSWFLLNQSVLTGRNQQRRRETPNNCSPRSTSGVFIQACLGRDTN